MDIRGPEGKPGANGMPGQNGTPGMPGKDGAPGQPGQDGAPGKDGHDGAPGKDVHLVKKEIKDLRVLREKMQTYGSLRLLPTDSICFSRIKKEKKQRSIPLKVQKVILEEKDREV